MGFVTICMYSEIRFKVPRLWLVNIEPLSEQFSLYGTRHYPVSHLLGGFNSTVKV